MLRSRIVLIAICLALPLGASAAPEKPTLAEHLLEILRADGTISEERYQELRGIAAAERQALVDVAANSDNDIRVGWKDGFYLENPKQQFKLQIGGRIQTDWATYDEESGVGRALGLTDDIGSGTEFRRARVFMRGQVAENVKFRAEYDFAGGDTDFNDVYLQFTDVPFANTVTVGHFKEPFSLEELTSANFLTFMERGLPNAFAPARNSGIMLNGNLWEESVTWAIGGFRQTDDFGDGFGDSDYNVSARLTGSPVYRDEGREVLHLGLSGSYRSLSNEPVAFASEPESNLGPDYLDTGDIASDSVWMLNPELAYVHGPFSLQAEYMFSSVDANSGSDPEFGGYYAYLSYFLTGEHRNYSRSNAAFGRVRPKQNFKRGGGPGAWEVAARYSHIDLDDEAISGGELADWTVALNWYLNPFTRLMFNYILADLEDAGDTNIFQARFQVDF